MQFLKPLLLQGKYRVKNLYRVRWSFEKESDDETNGKVDSQW
jgi:hypothetical protein